MIKNWNKFNESNSNVDYEEVFRNFKNGGGFTNQYWYAELSDVSILDCGYGLVEDEFNGDTWFKIGKLNELDDELKSIDGYYTYDGGCEIVNNDGLYGGGLLKDLDYPYHPDEDSFHLIPKSDVVRTFFKIKPKPNFGGNRIVI